MAGILSILAGAIGGYAPPFGSGGTTVPDKPTNIQATAGDSSATVTFTAPANGGSAITGYTVKAYVNGVATGISTSGVSTSITITGLTNGTAYTFTVKATNAIGTGKESDTSAVVTYKGLMAWGSGVYGQLGLGNTTYYSSPKQVGTLTNWSNIASSMAHTLGVKTDGTLWSWGSNTYGRLGLGNTTSYSSPKQVGALTNWSSVANGLYHAIGIKTDGTLWSWGRGTEGQLGLGNTTYYSSPKQVGALTNWSSVSCGNTYTIGLKTDGTLWSWGFNVHGQLGLGNTTYYSSPKQVGALSNWSSVSCGYMRSTAIKTDGTLWSWGGNLYGQLGLSNTTYYSSPKQVGTLTNWSNIAGGEHHAIGIKTDGTLWSWGRNNAGQLGLGNTTDYSSPTQVGALTNWSSVSCAQDHNLGVKTGGTLWAWGYNVQGQLGLGNTSNPSSPMQVGALTNWSSVSCGRYHAIALTNQGNNAVTPTPQTFVDDVFSTYLYTGNGSTQTITNGIDLAGKGGLVWFKPRNTGNNHNFIDSQQGINKFLISNGTNAAQTANAGYGVTSFNSDGFSLGNPWSSSTNTLSTTYAAWTFRKAAKFFDVVTYTGDGTTNKVIPHSLGSVPGMIITKRTDGTGNWAVWHRAYSNDTKSYMYLNLTDALVYAPSATPITIDASSFTIGTNQIFGNGSGWSYVAYLFAHDTSANGIIQCGSYTGNGSFTGPMVSLGWEPQYLMVKGVDTTSTNWFVVDNMRNFNVQYTDSALYPNLSNTEGTVASMGGAFYVNSTGFSIGTTNAGANQSGKTYIYMAIRRPNKPPTSGTQVFSPVARTGTGANSTITGVSFAIDTAISFARTQGYLGWQDRLRGATINLTSSGDNVPNNGGSAEYTAPNSVTAFNQNGLSFGSDMTLGCWNGGAIPYVNYFFKRAPGFMDVVCYTGAVGYQDLSHNLGAVPELVIIKNRTGTGQNWIVGLQGITGISKYLVLNSTAGIVSDINYFGSTWTSTKVLVDGNQNPINQSGYTYVMYLFATLAGISKVGSYTGNGTTQAINCGFTAGARFVMVKATSTTGDWLVVDSARGINAAADPMLKLNSTAVEYTGDDWIDADTSGFVVNQVATTNANASGVSYIYLAIA